MIVWEGPRAVLAAGPSLAVSAASTDRSAPALAEVSFRSDTPVAALQFDIDYDPGKLFATSPVLAPGASSHILASSEPAPGKRRFVLYSLRNLPLPTGPLLSLPVNVRSSAGDGVFSLTLTNAIGSTPTGAEAPPMVLSSGQVRVASGPAPRFTSIAVGPAGRAQLQIAASAGAVLGIQSSTNLVTWVPAGNVTVPAAGVLIFTDPSKPPPANRFYRAVQQ